jgi:hypothetical protein
VETYTLDVGAEVKRLGLTRLIFLSLRPQACHAPCRAVHYMHQTQQIQTRHASLCFSFNTVEFLQLISPPPQLNTSFNTLLQWFFNSQHPFNTTIVNGLTVRMTSDKLASFFWLKTLKCLIWFPTNRSFIVKIDWRFLRFKFVCRKPTSWEKLVFMFILHTNDDDMLQFGSMDFCNFLAWRSYIWRRSIVGRTNNWKRWINTTSISTTLPRVVESDVMRYAIDWISFNRLLDGLFEIFSLAFFFFCNTLH